MTTSTRNKMIMAELKKLAEDGEYKDIDSFLKAVEVHKILDKIKFTKPVRDPAKPKAVPTIYQMFCADHRADVRDKFGKSFSEINKQLSVEWTTFKKNAADHPGKKAAKQLLAWEEERAKLKAEYDEKMKEYVPAPGTESSSKKGPAKTDPKMPKRAPTEYLLFGKKHREEIKEANSDAAPKEITGLIAKAWAEFKEKVDDEDEDALKEMKSYKKAVKAAKAKFDEEMKSYVPSEGYDEKGKLKKHVEESDDSSSSEEDEKSKKKAAVKPKPATKKHVEESDDSSSSEEDESKKKAVAKPKAKKPVAASLIFFPPKGEEDEKPKKKAAKKPVAESDDSSSSEEDEKPKPKRTK